MATGKKIAVAEPAAEVAERINQNWRAARPVAGMLARNAAEEE